MLLDALKFDGDFLILSGIPDGSEIRGISIDVYKRQVQILHNREMHGTFRAPGAALAADTSAEELSRAVESLRAL